MSMERVEERVLVLAPDGRDSSLISDILDKAGISADICKSLEDLSIRLREGAGVALLAEEAIPSGGAEILFAELKTQPAWSDLQFLLLTPARGGPGPASGHFL